MKRRVPEGSRGRDSNPATAIRGGARIVQAGANLEQERRPQEPTNFRRGTGLRWRPPSAEAFQPTNGMVHGSLRPMLHSPFELQRRAGIQAQRTTRIRPDCRCRRTKCLAVAETIPPPPVGLDRRQALRRSGAVGYAACNGLRMRPILAGATAKAMNLRAHNATEEFELTAPSVIRTEETGPVPDFLDHIRRFADFGTRTVAESVEGIPYLVNAFWTAGQRQSHSLHQVSYRACFKAELPAFFISRLTRPGDTVLDPFMGRGTTPLQAVLMGRKTLGNDINPLSVLLARPRLREMRVAEVARALLGIDWSRGASGADLHADGDRGLAAFYHPGTLVQLQSLRRWISEHTTSPGADPGPVCDWIRMVAINRLSGHSPGFFSGRSMPPNQAVSAESQRKINARLGVAPPERDVSALILRKTRSLLRDGAAPRGADWRLQTGAAWDLGIAEDGAVDLVVTSPPFLDAVDYAADNWLRCWFAGIDPDEIAIDMHRSEAAWTAMVRRVLTEQARVLRPGGHVAFEVGEVRKGRVLLERLVWQAAEGLPFRRLCVVVNQQQFTKTSHAWGVANGRFGTNTNRIVLLQRC